MTIESVCPVCLKRLSAVKERDGDRVFLCKTCPEHGEFRTLIWNGPPNYDSWRRNRPEVLPAHTHTREDRGCPYDCGICPEHRQNTCCVLLEVTQRCSLGCPVCFASSGITNAPDPSQEEIAGWYDLLMESGGPFNIQLSGGEPTMRDDLPALIRIGKEKGFPFFQLNTNGLRLAAEPSYAIKLKEAGLDCVFLQFDGLQDSTYSALRGRPLLREKLAAIDACAEVGLGVVLVPTVAAGINDGDIGAVLDFAVVRMPEIRGVHFQPMSYFGRYPGELGGRLTIPDMLRKIEEQTSGHMKVSDFSPGSAENPYCSFSAAYLLQPDGSLKSLEKKEEGCCCGGDASRSRRYVAKHWSAAPSSGRCGSLREVEPQSFDDFIDRTRQYKLAVSGMVFQDAWNLDLDRLRQCYIHIVSPDRRVIPFCAYNLTGADGNTIYRGIKL